MYHYYMALFHKDWELPNSWIWLAETDIDRGLDFPSRPASRPVMFEIMKSGKRKSRNLKCKIIDCFHRTIFISVSGKKLMKAKCQSVQTSLYIKRIEMFLFLPYNKHLSSRAKSVCFGESWPRSCVQTSLRSVYTYDLGQDSPVQTSCSVNKS